MHNVVDFTEIEAYVARVWQGQRCILKPYFFNANFPALTAGVTETSTIKINSNADFLITEFRLAYNHNDGLPGVNALQIVDGATLEQFFSAPVALSLIATQNNIYRQSMSIPRRVAGNSLLTLTLQERQAAAFGACQLSLVGVLVFTL